MSSDFIRLSKTLLLELTEEELEALQTRAASENTTSRNILRRALKSYLGQDIPDNLFLDRSQGNKKSKSDPQPEAENQLGAA